MPRLPDHLRHPLTRRFQSTLLTASNRATILGQAAWDDLDGYDEANIDSYVDKASPAARALKAAATIAAVGYYATLIGRSAPPPKTIAAAPTFRDPFISVWQALKSGLAPEEAIAAGRARVDAVMVNLANATARETGGYVAHATGAKVAGWERVTNFGACEWCELVAGQVYASANTADFGHDRCGCTAAPIFD